MFYFRHATSALQVIGIAVVFVTTMFEFVSEIVKGDKQNDEMPLEEKGKEFETMNEENIEKAVKSDGLLVTERRIS